MRILNVIIGDMTISSGGVLRLNKSLVERMDIRPGDRLIIMQNTDDSTVTFQIQRGNDVIFLLSNGEVTKI